MACLLVLLDGRHDALIWGLALVFSGSMAVIKPPRLGLGKWGDLAVLGFLAALLLSFVPVVYWPTPDWRVIATDSLDIGLPASLSVHPWSSLEAYFCVLAGIVWLYSAMQWRINYSGRRRLMFGLSVLLSVWAGWVISRYFLGLYQVDAEGSSAPGFFDAGAQRAIFFALGGIATFGFAVEGFRHRLAMPLFGVPATLLCFALLYIGDAREGLVVYYLGVLVWFAWSFWLGRLPRSIKWGLPLCALVFGLAVWLSDRGIADIPGLVRFDLGSVSPVERGVAQDSFDLFIDSPVGGVGMGSFSAVFPYYQDASVSHLPVTHPGSDWLRLLSEGGLISVALLTLALCFYLRRCRDSGSGGSSTYRRLALVAALAFVGLGFMNLPADQPGTLYFGLLFAALALPTGAQEATKLPPLIWRLVGLLLCFVGLIWIVAGSLGWPFHSAAHYARLQSQLASPAMESRHAEALDLVDDWLELRPLDWRGYTERARRTLLLGGDVREAASDFERARFVEPISGLVAFEEGLAWMDRDVERAMAAWEIALSRELEDADAIFAEMLSYTDTSSNILNGVARLSELSPNFRSALLNHLRGIDFMRELGRELDVDPGLSHFNARQRSAIVENWIEHGDFDSARDFLSEHADQLENAWWLQSLIHKNQADFRQAVDSIRDSLEPSEMLASAVEDASLVRVSRQFAVQPSDTAKGLALLAAYLKKEDYNQALPVIDALLDTAEPHDSLHYWRAESLYHVNEYIESWFAFEKFLSLRWKRSVEPGE